LQSKDRYPVSRKNIIVAVVVAAVAIGIAVALLQPRPEVPPDDGGTIIADTEPRAEEIVNVASARSAFPFVQRWVAQYNNDDSSIGSVSVGYYLDEPVAPSDLVITGGLPDAASGLHHVPISAQAVVIVYNIPSFPDIPSGMKLNATLLSQVLNGSITRWNDPAISGLNPGLNLPSETIVVVHENNNSSSSVLLERYLLTGVNWSSDSIGVLGPDELAAKVRATPYSIGYVDFSYATQTRMTFAAIEIDGEYVVPSMASIEQAVEIGLQNVTANNVDFATINASRLDNSSYPITGLYYASWEPGNNATLDFVDWIIAENKGQQTLSEVQYPPVYRDGQMAINAERISNSTFREQAGQPNPAVQ
jgi:phosphate transport system substrate-binding protein